MIGMDGTPITEDQRATARVVYLGLVDFLKHVDKTIQLQVVTNEMLRLSYPEEALILSASTETWTDTSRVAQKWIEAFTNVAEDLK